jgi:uncharacterized membrane protein HdeD (DUF308 family)
MFVMTARKTLFVILGILMILAGITCFFTPVETSSAIPFIFGLAMVIDGIGRIIAWFSIREYAPQSGWVLASSIISLVFGLMLVTSPMLQLSVGVFVVLLTGWWILALGIIRIVHAFHLLKIKRESPDFVFGEMVGSNWWVALILGLLLGVLGVIVILNPLLGLGVIGVVVGCGMITAGINLIFLSTNVWLW